MFEEEGAGCGRDHQLGSSEFARDPSAEARLAQDFFSKGLPGIQF
jgi:hypothetical protein